MEIQNASTTSSKSIQLRNVNIVRWESGNVTTQPSEINNRKSAVNACVVNAGMNDTPEPPQRRQGPDRRLLLLSVGNPSAIKPELAFSRAEHSLSYSDVIYIFLLYYIYHLCLTCIDFYDLSAWVAVSLLSI